MVLFVTYIYLNLQLQDIWRAIKRSITIVLTLNCPLQQLKNLWEEFLCEDRVSVLLLGGLYTEEKIKMALPWNIFIFLTRKNAVD